MMKINCIKKGYTSKSELLQKRQYYWSNAVLSEKHRLLNTEWFMISTKGSFDWDGFRNGPPVYTPNPKHLYFQDMRFTQLTIRNWK